ncbi:MAG TPA: glycerol-3-phosphate 1-O-acyltransferase PlsY [Pseudolabrys sp.]|jgi:glycerol-3-phosphate acyltransferase PlsY|nr:glycerol-3-phosphate 1-O-acyltransferase PlsY [Pseudolabrys sp.]
MPTALAFLFGYLLGSIPFGLIITRAAGGPDVRTVGSGNIGATNVLRTGSKKLAAATLLGDMLKGAVAVLVTIYVVRTDSLAGASYAPLAAALGAFLGHLFPVWLGFKGGKGVATYIGVLFGLFWPAGLVFCAVWLIVAFLSRYSSLAALVAGAVTPAALYLMHVPDIALLFVVLSALLWVTHRANIARLLAGSESKIGAKHRGPSQSN